MTAVAAPPVATVPLVRAQVRDLLMRTPAFAALPEHERRDLAHGLVNVGQYLADAGGTTRDLPLALSAEPVRALDDPPRPDTAGQDFGDQGGAQAADAGVDALGNAIDNVDFPGFVAGLIDGVFNAIVTSSIKQMEAFAELVKNVSKSVDAFMKDNVSEDQARDYLVDRYPDHLEVDTTGDKATIAPRSDADTDAMPDFFGDLGLAAPVDSLDEDTIEQQLVPAARKKMAMDRQQVLLSLVLMGINRLIVTDGSIKATVVFQLDTRDKITKKRARTMDYNRTQNEKYSRSRWGWIFSPSSTYTSDTTTQINVNTVNKDDSEAKVDLKTKLTGDVNIRFKSDVFPLDKMTDILGVVKPEAPKPVTPVPAAAAPAAPAPLPPLPPMPATPGR
ncbi:hypothetical protein [Nocardioides sp. URHA0020]|uniref:hypothetical protein n=1 Tax=Nocardioides sp. URHA0020 TaxID=1380392 RepID=UPI00048BDA9E|nr:hypothetical protein [Nocardioides sp. URHA0020]